MNRVGSGGKRAPASYRWFQAVFSLLTLNFLIPSVVYAVSPETALAGFVRIGALLGGGVYPVAEHSILWRTLGATNVATLGVMCLLLQWDLRRFFPVLYPLVFMKGTTAVLFLAQFLTGVHYPGFLAIALFDGFSVVLMLVLPLRALRDLERGERSTDPAGPATALPAGAVCDGGGRSA